MSKSVKHNAINSLEILPMDTLINIFSRLPITSLLRFKCVCKTWRILITSRYFSNLHMQRNTLASERLLIFTGEDHCLYSISLDFLALPAVKIPASSAWDKFSRRKNIVGSCNGLLLCICDESLESEALLINPSALPCKRVPKLEVPQSCLYLSYGFGYDHANDDYKVVRIAHFLRWGMSVSVGVYSLLSDSWKLIGNVDALVGTPVSNNGTSVKKHLLHWLITSSGSYCIACFDVCREEWSTVVLPELNTGGDSRIIPSDLGVLDGCLCLMTKDSNVWIMKEYGDEESWVKLFNISDWCVIGSVKIAPITYSKEGNEILLRKDMFSEAFWYEELEKRTRLAQFCCLPKYRQVSVCTRSLISLGDHARMDH